MDHYDEIKNEPFSLDNKDSDTTDQRSQTNQPSPISSNTTPRKHPRAETVPQHTTTQLSPIHTYTSYRHDSTSTPDTTSKHILHHAKPKDLHMQRRPLIPRNPNDLEYLNETISSIHDDNLKVISTVSYLENYITHQLGQAINECINICTITNHNNHDIHEFITRQEQKMDQLIDITKQNMQLNNVIINRQSEILQTLNATITEFRNASAIKHSPIRSTLFNQTEAIPSLLSSATNTEERYTPYNTNPKADPPSSKHQSNNYPKEVSYDKNSNLIQITHYDCNILERIKSKSQATSICNSNADPSRILCATCESEQLRMEILSSSNFNGYPSSLYQTKILDQPPLNPIARRLCDVFFAAKRTALTQLRPITTPENITPLRISSSIEQILDTIDIINRYSNSGFMNDTNNLFDSTTISLIESRTDLPITSMSPFLIIELFFYLWTENFTNTLEIYHYIEEILYKKSGG